MALAAPVLDDRKFQDMVDEAKKRIPHYCKEWTDHNVSDPGVTLIELFAWMTDILLYRLNQVPDLHYIRFMEMMGITLREPVPAQVPVTFWLSAAQGTPAVIRAGTEVASTQTETERSIIFTTDADLWVEPPQWSAAISQLASGDGSGTRYQEHNVRRLQAGFEGSDIFSSAPKVNEALCFGFENNLSHHILAFDMVCDPAGGAGVDPTLPPYLWEASTGREEMRWQVCQVETDTTKAMNSAGRIQIHLPKMDKSSVGDKTLYWVRVRNREISPAEHREGMRPYDKSPRLCRVAVSSWGGTVPATHAQQVWKELLGRSDGTPGQRFYLQARPILKRESGEALTVQVEGEPCQTWTEVTDFADSGIHDRHYTLDGCSGELRLGPAVREPDGTIRLYGAIPPRGANLVFERYRFGGGQQGNVQAGILNTLKTAIPYIARVSNREAAWGGLDAETLEAARLRVPAMLRSRERAVTEGDFEYLARQALPAAIGRVKCLQPSPKDAGRVVPGHLYVLVIPRVPQPEGYLQPESLKPSDQDVAGLSTYLDERRLLTTQVDVRAPAYVWVAVKVSLRATPEADQATVEAKVLSQLYRFLNPLTGGPQGCGWPFGRDLYVSDVYQCLQSVPGIQFLRGVEMCAAEPGGGPRGEPTEQLEVLAHGVIASGQHSVVFV